MSSEHVVFTGKLTNMTRSEAMKQAEEYGYKTSNAMNKSTTILVCGEKVGAKKIESAQNDNITVMTEAEWMSRLEAEESSRKQVRDVSPQREVVSTGADEEKPSGRRGTKRTAENQANAKSPVKKTAKASSEEVVVFTGKLVTQTRIEAKEAATRAGFSVAPRVTKVTTIVVCGDKSGKKVEAAEKVGAILLSEEEWNQKLADSSTDDYDAHMDTSEASASADVQPKTVLEVGDTTHLKSDSGSTYTIKRTADGYTCSCPAWRFQGGVAPSNRSCKHLVQLLGAEFEQARVNLSEQKAQKALTPTKRPKDRPNVMLAFKWDPTKQNVEGWWMSEKLDGVRAYWKASRREFLSREGNIYPAPDWFKQDFPDDVDLDGELFGGRGQFDVTVGVVKTQGSEKWADIVYKVFDALTSDQDAFEDRMSHGQELVRRTASAYMTWVEHTTCRDHDHVYEMLKEIEALGGEGVMLRKPQSKYDRVRSKSLLKLKSFYDGEAEVVSHEGGKGKYKDMTGALLCRMASGKTFKVASGMSDAQRSNPPAIGSIIVYKCQELTKSGIPRFPTFVGIAADKSTPKDPLMT